jgi:hypothetical protein
MKTQSKPHLVAARLISSTAGRIFAPEIISRPRAGAGSSRALAVREWTEGQSFAVRINHGAELEFGVPAEKMGPGTLPGCTRAACAAALPLSFPGGFQYG